MKKYWKNIDLGKDRLLDIIVVRDIIQGNIAGAYYADRDYFVSHRHELEFMKELYDMLALQYCQKCHEFIVGIADTIDDFLLRVKKTPLPPKYDLN